MSGKQHHYVVDLAWTGNTGSGTSNYRSYERAYDITAPEPRKPPIQGSADPAFRGAPERWNPEELLVASAAACHQLWYLHLCAANGLVVVDYVDHAEGTMTEDAKGSGRFTEVILRPSVTFAAGADRDKAEALHHQAHEMCFIANSLNFPVNVEPVFNEQSD